MPMTGSFHKIGQMPNKVRFLTVNPTGPAAWTFEQDEDAENVVKICEYDAE
jgi:hypothetical protein